jgi:hypothetical protein
LKIEALPLSISSELEGNPPLWITKDKDSTEVYINNAKILMEYSNFVSKLKSQNGDVMIQVRKKKNLRVKESFYIYKFLFLNIDLLFLNEFTRCANEQ